MDTLSIIFLIIGVIIYFYIKSSKCDFNKLILQIFYKQVTWQKEKKLSSALSRSNPSRAALIRNLQIIRDSIEIARTSKNRKTAESRMELALQVFNTICRDQSSLMKGETFEKIAVAVRKSELDFHTKLYANLATGYMEKARKAKTHKTRMKYVGLARDILLEGLRDGRGHASDLESSLAEVDATDKVFNVPCT